MMQRAYSRIEIKSINDGLRKFSGIASTPSPDRVGDIVEPTGAQYSLPIPLLWQHDSGKPIGEIQEVEATKSGIRIRGEVFRATESRTLMDRLDEAWESIKLGLVKGLSIGFRPLDSKPIKNGVHFLKWDWHELSAVTIPANADASIQMIKSLDREFMAASGQKEYVVRIDNLRRVRHDDVVYISKTEDAK